MKLSKSEEAYIKQEIENWQDQNMIVGNMLYIFNKQYGYDKFEINLIRVTWIILNFKLIKVGSNTYQSEKGLLDNSISLMKENIEMMNIIMKNNSEIQSNDLALLNNANQSC